MGGRVVVVGAVNVDFVVAADRLPGPGETVVGPRVERFGGGKGANAAVAAARAGADVRLIGAVGDDDTGRVALEELRADGVRVDGVAVLDGVPTVNVAAFPRTLATAPEADGGRASSRRVGPGGWRPRPSATRSPAGTTSMFTIRGHGLRGELHDHGRVSEPLAALDPLRPDAAHVGHGGLGPGRVGPARLARARPAAADRGGERRPRHLLPDGRRRGDRHDLGPRRQPERAPPDRRAVGAPGVGAGPRTCPPRRGRMPAGSSP